MQQYMDALSNNVAIVSVMWANNESGTLFPVEEIAELASSAGIMFHTDAVQAVGKVPIDLKNTAIDMLSLSGHKLHAPKGIGALYLRRGTRFRPLLRGGHQERGRRAGTENSASIIALGKACELALAHMDEEKTTVRALRDRLEKGILESVPNCFVTGDPSNRLPNTCNIAFEYIEGEAILLLLNKLGIAASSGSACTSGSLEPSHVMRAMGIPFTAAHGTTRFSLSRYNTDAMRSTASSRPCRRSSRNCASSRPTGMATDRSRSPRRRSSPPMLEVGDPCSIPVEPGTQGADSVSSSDSASARSRAA